MGQESKHDWPVRQKLRNQLASFLRQSRGEATYAQFEKKVGISASTLHRIELAQQNVTLDTLEQIMDRLKVGMGDIFQEAKK